MAKWQCPLEAVGIAYLLLNERKKMNPVVINDINAIETTLTQEQKDRLRGSTILMTGCAGFLGYYFLSFFTHKAQELGIKRIIGLDNFMLRVPDWVKKLESAYPNILKIIKFDIVTDHIVDIREALDANFIIHAASIASPTFYRLHPLETIDANIWGLRSLLDFYKDKKIKGFLFFSSSEVYGDPDPRFIPTDEEYRGNVSCVGPRACYDESKRFGETLCLTYASKFNVPITIARPFNNYGPGMSVGDKRVPADFAKAVIENKDIEILSDGSPTRTFCYISDAISGYIKCLTYGKFDYFNIGTDKPEISIKDLAGIYTKHSQAIFGFAPKILFQTSNDKDYLTDNPNRRCPVITKAKELLQYNPNVSIEDGVKRFLEFLHYEKTQGVL